MLTDADLERIHELSVWRQRDRFIASLRRIHMKYAADPEPKETPDAKAEKAQAKADKTAAKVVATCAICGYELHDAVTTHCDACGHDHVLGKGDRCPNPNCTGLLA